MPGNAGKRLAVARLRSAIAAPVFHFRSGHVAFVLLHLGSHHRALFTANSFLALASVCH